MSKNKIDEWLGNPNADFKQGLSLYNQFKTDKKKDAFYSSAESFPRGSMQFNMLVGDLSRISRILGQKQEDSKEPKQVISTKTDITLNPVNKIPGKIKKALAVKIMDNITPEVNVNDLPADLKIKFNEIKNLTKSIAENRRKLEDPNLDLKEAQVLAEKVCDDFDQRKDFWAEIDYWAEHNGKGSKGNQENPEETVESLKKSIKLRNDYIARAQKRAEENPKNVDKENVKIEKWRKEIDVFDEKLKALSK